MLPNHSIQRYGQGLIMPLPYQDHSTEVELSRIHASFAKSCHRGGSQEAGEKWRGTCGFGIPYKVGKAGFPPRHTNQYSSPNKTFPTTLFLSCSTAVVGHGLLRSFELSTKFNIFHELGAQGINLHYSCSIDQTTT